MRKILVVDDNLASRELLRHILKASCQVLEAAHGQEALDKIAEAEPDLVLLDLEMPGLDGFAVLRQLRQHPRSGTPRVVAVTARAMQGDRERALEAGFDGYITKPISAATLRRQVEEILGS